jgi:hypothetical protein
MPKKTINIKRSRYNDSATSWTIRDSNPGMRNGFFAPPKNFRPSLGPNKPSTQSVQEAFTWGKVAGT